MNPRALLSLAALLVLAPTSASANPLGGDVSSGGAAQENDPFLVTQSIAEGSTLSGAVAWTAGAATYKPLERMDFRIDGKLVHRDLNAPFQYGEDPRGLLDTTALDSGQHTFAARATTTDGSSARSIVTATVDSAIPPPKGSPPDKQPRPSPDATAPTITGFMPQSGRVGTSVSIEGTAFTGVTAVRFNGLASSSYSITSDTSVTAVVPVGASTGPISVTTTRGTGASASSFTVTQPGPPTISGFTPQNGLPGIQVTINGANFVDVGSVTLGGTTATFATQSPTVILTTVPSMAAGTYQWRVTTPSGSIASTGYFTVSAPPSSSGLADFAGVAAYNSSDLTRIASLGVTRVRWDRPSANLIQSARSLGIEVLPIAGYNPWSDLNGGRGDKYPPSPLNYGEWSRRMVDTWRGMSQPPTAIEVWNEPWLTSFWQPMPNPAAYLQLVKAFAAEAWKVWPDLTILVSADTVGSQNTSGTITWRRNVLAADTTGFLKDPRIRPTTHNYVEGRTPTQVTSQPCYWDLDRYLCAYNDFKAHGHPNPKVWVTEFGWESGVVGETRQADYVESALRIFRDSGKVARSYAFLLKTNDGWSYNWLRPDNSEKPVVARVRSLLRT